MSDHPDVHEMRGRMDRIATSGSTQALEGVALLAGLYAAISPWVIDFHGSNGALTLSDLVVGLTVVAVALGLGANASRQAMSWVSPILGVWLIVSLWVIAGTSLDAGIIVSNVVVGAVVVLAGCAAMGAARVASRH
jgi:hypothetical protein